MAVNKGNYITILGFMVIPEEDGGLGLKGNEALVLATIYGFSQDGQSWYEGTQEYLAEWCGGTTRTIRNVLNSLLDKGLLEKRERKVKNTSFFDYRVTTKVSQFSTHRKNFPTPSEKFSDHIYIDIYNTPSDIDTNVSISSPPQGKRGFVKPTIDEVRAYCTEKGYRVDAEQFWHHYESNGWKVGRVPMKSWKSALVTWNKNRQSETAAEKKEGYRRA